MAQNISSDQICDLKARFESILDLSRDQISALNSGDTSRFRHALAAKGAVIESLSGRVGAATSDPGIKSLIDQIQVSEQESERLINLRLDKIRRELAELGKSKSASRQYGKSSRKIPHFVPSTETPMMFDHHR